MYKYFFLYKTILVKKKGKGLILMLRGNLLVVIRFAFDDGTVMQCGRVGSDVPPKSWTLN